MNNKKEKNTSIVKTGKNSNYTVISNVPLRDIRLSASAIGLLCKILSLPDKWHLTEIGLVKICKEGKDFIHQKLKELEKYNYVVKKRTRDEKGRFYYYYIIYENPSDVSPTTGEPLLANPEVGSPVVVDTSQLNNNKSSKEEKNIIEENTIEIFFKKIWSLYPRQEKYSEAKFELQNALKKVPLEKIEISLLNYIHHIETNNVERQYIKLLSTWLKKECWNEYYPEAPSHSYEKFIDYKWWEEE